MRASHILAAALVTGAVVGAGSDVRAQALVQGPPSAPPAVEEQFASPLVPPKLPSQAVPQEVTAAWGCVVFGSVGTAAAVGASSVNLLNVIAGGVVTPANPAVLYLGLAGVVFTSFCTLGQQLTPLYTYYLRGEPEGDIDLAKDVRPRMAATAQPLLAMDEEQLYPWQSAR